MCIYDHYKRAKMRAKAVHVTILLNVCHSLELLRPLEAHNNLERALKVGENYHYFSKHTCIYVPAVGRSATAGWWMKLGDDP